jgi:hypothetical protein
MNSRGGWWVFFRILDGLFSKTDPRRGYAAPSAVGLEVYDPDWIRYPANRYAIPALGSTMHDLDLITQVTTRTPRSQSNDRNTSRPNQYLASNPNHPQRIGWRKHPLLPAENTRSGAVRARGGPWPTFSQHAR